MRRNRLLALGLAATTALGAAIAVPALAHGTGGNRGGQGYSMEGRQEYGREGRMEGRGGWGDHHDMMERMHGPEIGSMAQGMMGGSAPGGFGQMPRGMMGEMMKDLDTNEDGIVSPEEFRTGLEARLAEYDADGNGSLSIDEFEALYSAMIRERMVDRFQFFDNDGDGQITAEEMAAPADRMERMQEARQRMMDTRPSQGQGQGPGMMQDLDDDGMGRGMMQSDDQ